MTRQNRVPVGGTDENPEFALALIPLWDLLNHSNGKLTTFHDCKAQRTEYNAMQSFNKGDQVLMFYGARTNAELLLHSGFVMEDNPHDYLLVKLGISTGDKLKELKCSLLDALQVPTSGDFVIGLDGEPEAPLNAFIRINSMTEEELQQHFETPQICATLGDKEGRVNDENETRACLFLEMRCKLLLRAYQSTVSADDALLTDTSQDQTYHASCAVRKRRSEMAILEACALVVAERGLEEEL